MRKLKVFNLLLVLLAFWSSFSFAYDPATCSNLKTNSDYSVTFTVNQTSVKSISTIYVDKGVGEDDKTTPIALWSNGISALIEDDITTNEGRYTIWLTYQTTGNKQGELRFYLLNSGTWELIEGPVFANLKDLKSVNIAVSGADVKDLECDVSSEITEPEVPEPELDLCRYFPEPAQSWKSGSSLNIYNPNTTISGWSYEYVETYFLHDKLKTSFDNVNSDAGDFNSCDVGICTTGADKIEYPESVYVNFSSTTDLYIEASNYKEKCTVANNCQYTESGEVVYLNILGALRNLTVNEYSSPVHFIVNFEPTSNNYGPVIQSYNSGGSTETVFQADGIYSFGSMSFSSGGTLRTYSDVILNIVNSFTLNNSVDIKDEGSKKDLIIYGPTANFEFSQANSDVYAQILAEKITFNNPTNIRGAVTTNSLTMYTQNIHIYGEGACLTSSTEKSDYTLELSPRSDIALSCDTESIQPTLSVLSDGALATDFTGNIVVTIDGELEAYPVNNGSFSKELEISGGGASKTVSVDAYIEGDESTKVTGSYQFVPYNLKIDDQYVIANRSVKVSAIAQACNDDKQVVDFGYDGEPDVSSQWVRPTSGAVGSLTYSPSFSSGKSSNDLTLEDSGELLVTLTDANFTCSGDDCPIEGDGETKILKGQFTVYSRPWTFAICSTDNTNLDNATGDSNSGNGFIAAGETFDAKVLPLRYIGNGSISGGIASTSSLCGQDVTSNFFLGDSSDNTVVLSSSVETPTQSDDLVFSSEISRKNSDNEYTFTDLSWEDVGSLKLMAATSDNSSCASGGTLQTWYECTQMGYREVGRFYPAYFEVTQSDWWVDKADAEDTATEPYSQNNIAYLSQPFGLAEVEVVPFSLNGRAIENYSQFVASLQAKISVLEDEDLGDRLTVSVSDGEWDNDSTYSRWYLEDQYAVFYRDFTLNTQGVRESSVDGPFNVSEDANSTTTNFGFTISTNSDPIDSRTQNDTTCLNSTEQYSSACDLSFPTQPPARYGRMAMDDVGGTSVSTINIPLRVEYWNGSRFITNTDDSASDYSSDEDYVCYQEVWSEASGSDGSLKAVTKTVDSGVSDELYATPYSADDSSSIRQQIRFWLRMDDTSTTSPQTLETDDVTCGSSYMSQPWLQYNWRGKGDEDPSSVVTFGIHRGNDRVIYRGEPGLTAQ